MAIGICDFFHLIEDLVIYILLFFPTAPIRLLEIESFPVGNPIVVQKIIQKVLQSQFTCKNEALFHQVPV